jgi:hypothetical protein
MDKAIGMLYSLIIRFPDLDPMLRPVILELEMAQQEQLEPPVIEHRH